MKKDILVITMPDGSEWGVPVEIIARDRAESYAAEFDGDVDRSLKEDTLPLFAEDEYNVQDWAANNMNWDDVEKHARKIKEPGSVDYQDGLINGDKSVRKIDWPPKQETSP